jgi:hypothetical protein
MRKNNVIILISIVLNFVVFNNQINAQYSEKINYPDVQQELKEFLAIQGLLSENRMSELISFFNENNYYSVPGLETTTYSKIYNDQKFRQIHLMVQIHSGKFSESYVDNSLTIFFNIKNNQDSTIVYPNKENALLIQQFIRNEMELGLAYILFKQMDLEELKLEEIDRYTVKSANGKIYKASNFMIIPPGDEESITFFGPGKTSFTSIYFDTPIGPVNEDGGYLCRIRIGSTKLEDPKEKDPFNLNFFMSLKNFNDRIWDDN